MRSMATAVASVRGRWDRRVLSVGLTFYTGLYLKGDAVPLLFNSVSCTS